MAGYHCQISQQSCTVFGYHVLLEDDHGLLRIGIQLCDLSCLCANLHVSQRSVECIKAFHRSTLAALSRSLCHLL